MKVTSFGNFLLILQKLRQRHSTFQRQSFNEDDRKKWEKFLIVDFMSSEESDVEDAEPVLVVKALPWRSERVTRFLMKLDEKTQQSEQSQRQSKRRVRSRKSMVSDRPAPLNGSMPSWTIIHVRGKWLSQTTCACSSTSTCTHILGSVHLLIYYLLCISVINVCCISFLCFVCLHGHGNWRSQTSYSVLVVLLAKCIC